MSDEPDPVLTRLFAEQSEPVLAANFVARFISLMEREQRRRRAYRTGAIIAGVMVAALIAPWIAELAAITIGSLAIGIAATHSLLNFPMAWLALSCIGASVLPVVYLGVTRRW